ncbi:MAG TPA: glycine cleavage system aminomethyltransferase GcvT [Solirubrobacteraceae bacterium]|nr:glycine cleavage system aminomethyltransferase GcvT [Solirubrobacteraceae bacterium]
MATIVDRPGLVTPGLAAPDPGVQTWWVRPGGATVVQVRRGDRLTVRDPDGGQPAELTVLDHEGGEDAAALGARADAPATVLRAALGDGAAAGFLAALHRRGLKPDAARAVLLFGRDSPPGASQSFTAQRDATVVVAGPGDGRIVEGAWPASALTVEIERADPPREVELELPPPLAEPRLDFRVDKASALSYEVREGEYIQIIDVRGRQCSDFLAFNAHKLEAGVERGLDAQVTRTLMGNAYPTVGLHSKYYDLDMDPLCQIVQDTVGRHDSFALACTSKYYEDLGYFGHRNCTENFNRQLDPFGIAPRKGWEALNFFYNTGFDRDLVMFLDEPWSRPGDFVLLRALNDLVCASSACPDDIDPANGWQITDVHVRVYAPENRFQMAIAHRVTPDAEPVMTKQTAFHPRWSQLTRNVTEYRGYWLPTCFTNEGAIAEYWACREKAAVMDLSPLRKWEVLGPDAEALIQAAITRDARRLAVGQVVYTAMCNETGGMIDDATVFRLGDDNFRFVGGDEYDGVHLKQLAERLGLRRVFVKPSTDELHNIAVQGPRSRDILRDIVWAPPTQPQLDELRWFRFLVGRIGSYDGIPLVVSRTGYSGELGYEIFCHPEDGPAVWDAVMQAGRPHGLIPLGLDALDMLRIEAGLIFAGYEFDDSVDPFEAGIGFTVKLDTPEDFVGKQALIERSEHPQRRLVGLELEGNEAAGHGDCVHEAGGRSQVGVITSGTRSPTLRRNIALCRMSTRYAEVGTQVEVGKLDGHQKRIPATVVRFPFYDPEKKRPRS